MHLEQGYRSPNGITPPTLPTTRLIFDIENGEDTALYNLLKVYIPHAGHYWRYDEAALREHGTIVLHDKKDDEQIQGLIADAQKRIDTDPKLREELTGLAMIDVDLVVASEEIATQRA